MNLKILALSVLMMIPAAFAGKVVTYTATSRVSQEEANNAAMAGVAKQISSQVKTSQTLSKAETTANGKSNYSENYSSQSNVQSNLKIKGITVKPEPAEKGYKATATLDMDEYTADIQFKIKTIQQDVAKYERMAKQAMDDRLYLDAVNAVTAAKPLIADHKYLVAQLGQIYTINDSHRLQHNIPAIESDLINRLSEIKIQGPQTMNITKPEMPDWDVVVSDRQGPIPNFPVIARQARKLLAQRRTDSDGSVTFSLKSVNFDKGPYVIIVEPDLDMDLLKAAGLYQKFELSYKAAQSRCSVRLQCDEADNVCNAIEKKMAKKSIYNDDVPGAPDLKVKITATEGKTLNISPTVTRITYNVDLSIKGGDVSFITSASDNGKNESEAVVKAIGKMDFNKLQKQLEAYCQ